MAENLNCTATLGESFPYRIAVISVEWFMGYMEKIHLCSYINQALLWIHMAE
jgi:hypothetical protein